MLQKTTYQEKTGNLVSQTVLVPACLTVEQQCMIQQRNYLYQEKLNQRNSSFWNHFFAK